MATAPAPSATKRVTFAAYDLTESQPHKKPSATAFAVLRRALFQSGGKPANVELAGAWRVAAELQMLFSDLEYKHEEVAGVVPDQFSQTGFREAKVPVIVLNPKGATFVVKETHTQQLRAIFDEWVKQNAKYSDAMAVHITYQWFDGGNIVDASDEPAVRSGAVAPVGAADVGVVAEKPADAPQS
jgi:hypothetical protein